MREKLDDLIKRNIYVDEKPIDSKMILDAIKVAIEQFVRETYPHLDDD